MKGIFITGTDTDIGKTIVTAGILRALRGEGLDVVPAKPIQSGAVRSDVKLQSQDLALCLKAAKLNPAADELTLMSRYLFEPACSPHLAARMAGEQIEIPTIRRDLEMLASGHQGLVVEGAGGVIVPINEQQTMLDLMVALALPVVLVARGSLGTINHSLLSLQTLKNAGLDVLGIVFCDAIPCADDFIRRDNPKTIAQFGKTDILGDIPHCPALAAEDISDNAWDDFQGRLTGLRHISTLFK